MEKNKGLQIGDALPTIALNDENGNLVELDQYKGQPMVIYFYPKDDTPGCTKEACTFRDQFADFQDVGATVFGISGDSPKSHLRFKQRHNLPFSLLSDRGNKVRKQLGIKASLFGLLPGRVTFVIGKDGTVIHKFTSQFDAERHVKESINAIKAH